MQIQTRENSISTTIIIPARLDNIGNQAIKDTINKLIYQNNTRIVADMSKCGYFDGCGFDALVAALRRVRENGGDIKLASPSLHVRKIIELTRSDRIFDIYDDVSVAEQSYQSE